MSVHSQPDFLNPEPTPRGPLDGLIMRIDRPCPRCRSLHAAIVDAVKGPHVAILRCAGCDRFQQWMPRDAHKSLLKVVAEFGRPTEPIRLFETSVQLSARQTDVLAQQRERPNHGKSEAYAYDRAHHRRGGPNREAGGIQP
jgi:hypothetical protein